MAAMLEAAGTPERRKRQGRMGQGRKRQGRMGQRRKRQGRMGQGRMGAKVARFALGLAWRAAEDGAGAGGPGGARLSH
jgi:hypothetical protein